MTLFSSVRELNPSKSTWAIRARLIRFYRLPVFGRPNEIATHEMIFHDIEGTRIHATMKISLLDRIRTEFIEGHLYAIRNFVVLENRSNYKTVPNKYKILFYGKTHVFGYTDTDFHSISMIYNFKDFEQLANIKSINESELIDVIGNVVAFQPPTSSVGTSRRMEFRIENLQKKQISCTLWEDYVDCLLPHLEKSKCSARCCCNTLWQDDVKISNTYHVTKVIVNGDSEEFQKFGNRFEEGQSSTPINKVLSTSYYALYDEFQSGRAQVRTLAQISDLNEDFSIGLMLLYWILKLPDNAGTWVHL